MTSRALSFGEVAVRYERFRPGYPDELVHAVLDYAGRPVRQALEIGAGTGKATRAFAARGVDVTATDPDGAMFGELRRHVPAGVVTMQASLEDLGPTGRFDLVFAAASLHWTEPSGRWPRIAARLEPAGVVASFGGPVELADEPLQDAVRAARAPFLSDDGVPSPDGTPPDRVMQWPGTELEQSPLFTDVRQLVIERRLRWPAQAWVGYLSTVSAYLQLPGVQREQVFTRTLQVLPEQVEVHADVILHLARRPS
ncbi:class I SAM-dependent methyltransferase [Dermatophilaceae bacterium Soc4.6]